MAIRVLAAAFMAALGATLGLMIARVAVMPAVMEQVAENDFLLLHHVGLGAAGSLVLQLVLLSRPDLTGAALLRTGLLWGLAGFLVMVLAPWLAQPDTVPGKIPSENGDKLFLWVFAVGVTAVGLQALRRPGVNPLTGRFAGLVLLALPLLIGSLGWTGTPDRLDTPGYGLLADTDPDFGVWRLLGLNLLFWLLLGVFSALTARRAMPARREKTGPAETPPEG